jgi:hypothetical protein
VTGPVDALLSNLIRAQLLFREAENPRREISLYVNSPGGSVVDALVNYDTMHHLRSEVATLAMGQACSVAALLVASGTTASAARRRTPGACSANRSATIAAKPRISRYTPARSWRRGPGFTAYSRNTRGSLSTGLVDAVARPREKVDERKPAAGGPRLGHPTGLAPR